LESRKITSIILVNAHKPWAEGKGDNVIFMKFIKAKISITVTIILIVLAWSVLYILVRSPYYNFVFLWAQDNKVKFFLFLSLFKFISIAIPPLVGGVVTLGAVPLIGWELAFLTDLIGSTLGGSLNYYLGKKYGYKIIHLFIGPNALSKIKRIKIKKGREIEGIVVTKVLLGATLLELIHYVAGMLKIDFAKYLIGITVSHLIIGIPMFYLFSNIMQGTNTLVTVVSIIVAVPLFIKLRGRYFE
jgi:uncharacterized membrane protein YdjX (TVP38/TMEM64 family)